MLVNGAATPTGKSTTGAPEGCPASVPAMISISYLWTMNIGAISGSTFVYADNWEWYTGNPDENRAAYTATKSFCSLWRQKMSMLKCWAWATDNANKVMWKKLQSVEQVQGQTFSIQKSETDLGATIMGFYTTPPDTPPPPLK